MTVQASTTTTATSKIPRPLPLHQKTSSTTATSTVPDFQKLHQQWQRKQELQKNKLRKAVTVPKEFHFASNSAGHSSSRSGGIGGGGTSRSGTTTFASTLSARNNAVEKNVGASASVGVEPSPGVKQKPSRPPLTALSQQQQQQQQALHRAPTHHSTQNIRANSQLQNTAITTTKTMTAKAFKKPASQASVSAATLAMPTISILEPAPRRVTLGFPRSTSNKATLSKANVTSHQSRMDYRPVSRALNIISEDDDPPVRRMSVFPQRSSSSVNNSLSSTSFPAGNTAPADVDAVLEQVERRRTLFGGAQRVSQKTNMSNSNSYRTASRENVENMGPPSAKKAPVPGMEKLERGLDDYFATRSVPISLAGTTNTPGKFRPLVFQDWMEEVPVRRQTTSWLDLRRSDSTSMGRPSLSGHRQPVDAALTRQPVRDMKTVDVAPEDVLTQLAQNVMARSNEMETDAVDVRQQKVEIVKAEEELGSSVGNSVPSVNLIASFEGVNVPPPPPPLTTTKADPNVAVSVQEPIVAADNTDKVSTTAAPRGTLKSKQAYYSDYGPTLDLDPDIIAAALSRRHNSTLDPVRKDSHSLFQKAADDGADQDLYSALRKLTVQSDMKKQDLWPSSAEDQLDSPFAEDAEEQVCGQFYFNGDTMVASTATIEDDEEDTERVEDADFGLDTPDSEERRRIMADIDGLNALEEQLLQEISQSQQPQQ